MSKQQVKIEPINVPDILAERTPFWYARLKTTLNLSSLNNNRTIQVGNHQHNTNLSIPKSCIAGEIHGFTGRYSFNSPDTSLDSICDRCDEFGNELSHIIQHDGHRYDFECILKHFADHIVAAHPPKILLQGA